MSICQSLTFLTHCWPVPGVECGEVVQDSPLGEGERRPRVAVVSRGVGGRAAFSCPPGYALSGPTETVCLPAADWARPFPICKGEFLTDLYIISVNEQIHPPPSLKTLMYIDIKFEERKFIKRRNLTISKVWCAHFKINKFSITPHVSILEIIRVLIVCCLNVMLS